jgi:hypothetical protein
MVTQSRGSVPEYASVLPRGVAKVRHALPTMLEDTESSLTWSAREWLLALAAEWRALDR